MSDDSDEDGVAGGAESGDGADGGSGSADDGRDPFDSFEGYDDREGDPFEQFEDGDESRPAAGDDASGPADSDDDSGSDRADPTDPEDAQTPDADPFEYMGDRSSEPGRDAAGGPSTGDAADRSSAGDAGVAGERADPLADVTVSDEDPFEANAGAFERSDVAGIDPDEVWARLTADPDPVPPEEAEDDVVEVSKHSYCEGCEFFSAPPAVSCAHEGTDILEFVDVDTVRVANCPVVAERRELEDD